MKEDLIKAILFLCTNGFWTLLCAKINVFVHWLCCFVYDYFETLDIANWAFILKPQVCDVMEPELEQWYQWSPKLEQFNIYACSKDLLLSSHGKLNTHIVCCTARTHTFIYWHVASIHILYSLDKLMMLWQYSLVYHY